MNAIMKDYGDKSSRINFLVKKLLSTVRFFLRNLLLYSESKSIWISKIK